MAAGEPHLVSLGGGRLSTAVTIHHLPIGEALFCFLLFLSDTVCGFSCAEEINCVLTEGRLPCLAWNGDWNAVHLGIIFNDPTRADLISFNGYVVSVRGDSGNVVVIIVGGLLSRSTRNIFLSRA